MSNVNNRHRTKTKRKIKREKTTKLNNLGIATNMIILTMMMMPGHCHIHYNIDGDNVGQKDMIVIMVIL